LMTCCSFAATAESSARAGIHEKKAALKSARPTNIQFRMSMPACVQPTNVASLQRSIQLVACVTNRGTPKPTPGSQEHHTSGTAEVSRFSN